MNVFFTLVTIMISGSTLAYIGPLNQTIVRYVISFLLIPLNINFFCDSADGLFIVMIECSFEFFIIPCRS